MTQPQQRQQGAQPDADGIGPQVGPFAGPVRNLQLQQLDRSAEGQQDHQHAKPGGARVAPAEYRAQSQRAKGGQVVEFVPAQVHLARRGG